MGSRGAVRASERTRVREFRKQEEWRRQVERGREEKRAAGPRHLQHGLLPLCHDPGQLGHTPVQLTLLAL